MRWKKVQEEDIPADSNVISSHSLFSVKSDNDGNLILKVIIVVDGHFDEDKYERRADSAAVDMFIVRLFLCLGNFLRFTFACSGIKGTFIPPGPITRSLYVRPPGDCLEDREALGKPLKLSYGMI